MTSIKHKEPYFAGCSLSLCLILLLFPKTASEAAYNALGITARTVLPVLIPYTVLANIIADTLSANNKKTAVLTAFTIGNLCGAPIGAVSIGRSFANGIITKKEAGYLLPAVSCASPAFCISAVGINMFNNANFGLSVYLIQLTVNLAVLLIYFVKNKSSKSVLKTSSRAHVSLSDAISRTFVTLGSVSVAIIFFTVLTAVITDLLNLNPYLECLLNSILEMCGATAKAAMLNYPVSYLFAGYALGFGGISVYAQICSCTNGISKKPYFAVKLINGTLCALISILNSPIFASAIEITTK